MCNHVGDDVKDPGDGSLSSSTHNMDTLKTFIREHVPGLKPEPNIVETCLYTVSNVFNLNSFNFICVYFVFRIKGYVDNIW